jgi:hypothetical protein
MPPIVIEMLQIEQQLQQKVARGAWKYDEFQRSCIYAYWHASMHIKMHLSCNGFRYLEWWSSQYYYLLIGVPKMDTWRGCDDLSLDRPDPWGTGYRPQSQAPLSFSKAAPSAHN